MGIPMLLHLGGRSARAHYPVIRRVIAGGTAIAAAALAARAFGRVEVVGDSMRPTLEPGDRLVVLRTRKVRRGDMVAVPDPRDPRRLMVKRVASSSDGKVTVHGDNPAASTDSRSFGPVDRRALWGRAVFRYFPPQRRARLWR